MNKYAISTLVTKQPNNIKQSIMIVEARSSEEAYGIGMKIALKLFPKCDEWRDHHIMVLSIDATPVTLEGGYIRSES